MSKNEIIERELCAAEDMPNNSMKDIEIKLDDTSTVKVLLIKSDNQFSCLSSLCSHYSVPLSIGVLHKGRLRCMAHGACFDAKTGDIEDYPGINCLPKFNVFQRKGLVYIKATREELETKQRIKSYKNEAITKSFIAKKPKNLTINTKVFVTDRLGRPVSVDNKQVNSKQINISTEISLPKVDVDKTAIVNETNKVIHDCLIIGSGAAGMICMETLRENGFGAGLFLIRISIKRLIV